MTLVDRVWYAIDARGRWPSPSHLQEDYIAMPIQADRTMGRDRPGRGGTFKPLLPPRQTRSLGDVLAETQASSWLEAISVVLDYGAALLLSPTSDGGAFSVTLLDGDERLRTYCATPDEVSECLAALYDHCADPRDAQTSTSKRTSKVPG